MQQRIKEQGQKEAGPGSPQVILVLCGGVGHSTHYMHEALARHPQYGMLAERVRGQPEARVLQAIAEEFFGLVSYERRSETREAPTASRVSDSLTILVEDQSTNCGANAALTKELLARHGILRPRSIVVAQDPTMCLRTAASFERLYEGEPATPDILCWPTFVPQVKLADRPSPADEVGSPLDHIVFQVNENSGPRLRDLWTAPRFADLIMGEIPRLRDDAEGYGPRGKGFISHVDVPQPVETAWQNLRSSLGQLDRAS
jgi:uncharacterized SAM-binding protein YcdF (DUF218 family)